MAHSDAIAVLNLAAGHQIRQWLYQEALDSALQVPRAIPEIGAFHQQEPSGGVGDIDQERRACGSLDTLFHHRKLNIDDPAQFLIAEGFENHNVVKTVDKLRRELSTSGRDSGTSDPDSDFRIASSLVH